MSEVIIAIDGPAGSGKSTVAKKVAERLNYLYIDSGAMYRAVALKAAEAGLSLSDATQFHPLQKNLIFGLKKLNPARN